MTGIPSRFLVTLAALGLCVTISSCATPRAGGPVPIESVAPTIASPASPTPSLAPEVDETPIPQPDVSVVVVTLDVVDGILEVSGIVPGMVEEGGACTLTLTRQGESRVVVGTSTAGQESSYCGLLTVPTAELARGEWQAVLEYRSDEHHGVSDASPVVVP